MLEDLIWIVGGGLAMSAIALVGGLTAMLGAPRLERIRIPLVALAAGSMLGGAFFHLLPAGLETVGETWLAWTLVASGFATFFVLEQLLHRRHRKHGLQAEPFTYLILIGDGLHNFLGGLAIASAFLADYRLGITAWLAAALHEVPQEFGDFAVLTHGGWSRRRALLLNLASGLTFLVGALLAWALARGVDTGWLVPFAAGNFLYIGASDLMPEINRQSRRRDDLVPVAWFFAGLALLWLPMLRHG